MKFRYYLVPFDDDITGTDSAEEAMMAASSDDHIVIDAEGGCILPGNARGPLTAIEKQTTFVVS